MWRQQNNNIGVQAMQGIQQLSLAYQELQKKVLSMEQEMFKNSDIGTLRRIVGRDRKKKFFDKNEI